MDGIRVDRRPRIAIAGLRQPPRRGEDYRRADDRVCAIKPGAICPDCAEVGQWSSVSANVVKLHSQGPETVAAPVNVGVPETSCKGSFAGSRAYVFIYSRISFRQYSTRLRGARWTDEGAGVFARQSSETHALPTRGYLVVTFAPRA